MPFESAGIVETFPLNYICMCDGNDFLVRLRMTLNAGAVKSDRVNRKPVHGLESVKRVYIVRAEEILLTSRCRTE